MNSMESALRLMAAQQPTEPERPMVDRGDPLAPMQDRETPVAGTVPAPALRPLFASDRQGGDDLARAGEAAFLAELLLHEQAQTPFCVALLGASGSGKSVLLDATLGAAERLAAAAASAASSPFCTDVLTVRVDASGEGDADDLLLRAVAGRIAETHPALGADLRHAGADPAEASRRADAALDAARRKLETERQMLGDLRGRQARMVEDVVDAPGSLVDAYARSKRARIDRILRQFGFASTDPVATYKSLVREAAEENSPLARAGLLFRSLWAYKGQTRLIITAVILFGLAWALDAVRADQDSWIGSIRNAGDKATPVADWVQAHIHWLAPIETAFLLLGVLLLLLDVIRAARFVLPLARGVDLLQQDLEGRRRTLSGQLAHQTRRVDVLAAEVEAVAGEASAAARRAAARVSGGAAAAAGAADATRDPGDADAVFRALAVAMAHPDPAMPTPRRIVLGVDNLDQRSGEGAARVVAVINRLLGEGCVAVVAVQQSHLMAGFGDTDPARATAQFARCIQLPYRVGAADSSDVGRRSYAATLMEGGALVAAEPAQPADPTRSALDAPWRQREAETVAALSPFAGETPRAIKRYVNLYRVARADPRLKDAPEPVFTALALALALDMHGFPDDLSALERATHGEAPGEATILRKALAVARESSGQPVELGQAQRALDVAESYTGRL